MTAFPFSFGPTDDWDPQGYANTSDEEELEDELMNAGMTVKTDDTDDEDAAPVSVEEVVAGDIEEKKADDEDKIYDEASLDPLAALDDLADQVNRTERETMRFKVFDE